MADKSHIPAPVAQAFGKIIKSEFRAPFWARNRHVQTIWPRFVQKRKPLQVEQERLDLPDGDFVNLLWGKPKHTEKSKGLAVIFHGLEGSIKSHYANDIMAHLQGLGWQTVLMHFRGCGGEPNRTTRAYHSGETEDAAFFLQHLQTRFPDLNKVAVGFSLGANMLLKWLGEQPGQRLLNAAVAVSAPLKLAECAHSINKGFSRVYQHHLLGSMKRTLLAKLKSLDYSKWPEVLPERVNQLKSFKEFDQLVTAPLHGFTSADHYYQDCSAIGYLKHIQTPTLILHSIDDPFMNEKVLPEAHDLSAQVTLELSEQGGHVGFMQGTPWRPITWMHNRISDYLAPYAQVEV